MRHFIIFIVLCLTACEFKSKYSIDRYTIPKKYRDLISSYNAGDSLSFSDGKGNLLHYLIVTIDSSFIDEGKGLMNVRGRKDISVIIRELTNPRKGYEEYHMIILNRYPDKDSATFALRFRDFYSIDTSQPFVIRTDTKRINDLTFTNYYSFRPENYLEQKDSNSIMEICMTTEKGIIAFKNLQGVWWAKVK